MNRNKFLASIVTIMSVPGFVMSQIKEKATRLKKGFKVVAGEGRIHGHIKLKGVNSNILDLKISGTDTDGSLAIFEQTSISQGKGTPLHIHLKQDEVFYVVDGSYKFKVGDDYYDLTTGDSIFLPREVPHAWLQVSKKGKMIVIFQPAGKMENFFVTLSALDHEPDTKEMSKIFEDNDMKIEGAPLVYKVN